MRNEQNVKCSGSLVAKLLFGRCSLIKRGKMMTYKTLISTGQLAANLIDNDWVVVDCRFSLADTEKGRQAYQQAHIAGAVYAHLDEDLSGPIVPGKTSRHPLPDIKTFAKTVSNWGINNQTQVVAYDDMGGAIAARLWWMLRWLGHETVAVLDGGWPRWQREGRQVMAGVESNEARTFVPHLRAELVVNVDNLLTTRNDSAYRLFDCRSADRFRGENETIDPVAGHIPGAVSLPYADNMDTEKNFLPPEQLRTRFGNALGETPPEQAVFYCGSGVTAAHNILAMLHAGLGEARLYPGSWSEWITDPERPVATGTS
jgi:thiosulfate/3-mercaptopyruvate sulfurtransferase